MLEPSTIMGQLPKVAPKHLLIQIAEQVERFHAHVGSLQPALQGTPEILESVGMNAAMHVTFSMVNDFTHEILVLQSFIGHERVSEDRASGFYQARFTGLGLTGERSCAGGPLCDWKTAF